MIEVTNMETFGWAAAIRGMRNPMNSWELSDTNLKYIDYISPTAKVIGYKDLNLMKNLADAGTDHRKFMRMITIFMDISAPLYWWKEFDTYKVGTVSNSCSTMHKIMSKEFVESDFSWEHVILSREHLIKSHLKELNVLRDAYMSATDPKTKKDIWYQLIQTLPSSYNQKRTVEMNYEVAKNIYEAREGHKLDEWRIFRKKLEELPHSELITE